MNAEPKATAGTDRLILALLALLLVVSVLNVIIGAPVFHWLSGAAFLGLCALGFRFFTIREGSLLVASIVVSIAVWWRTSGLTPMIAALDLAAFFGAFIAALTVMREVAARSRSILAVGRYLVQQPPGRRFFTTAFGGHALGVFLNFGAVSLMAPLIQESAKDANGETLRDLERRQLSALIRGFAWVLLWAPTTLTQATLLTIFTDVTLQDIAPLGLVMAVMFIVLGRVYDWYEWRDAPAPARGTAPFLPVKAMVTVATLCILLISLTVGLSTATGVSIAVVLMCVTPCVTILWFMAQSPPHSMTAVLTRVKAFGDVMLPAGPSLARSAVALGLSGYLGRCLGQGMPFDQLSQIIDLATIPGWLFLSILPVLITIGGQFALSPIMIVVLIGEILRNVEMLPTGQAQIVFALSVGWALSMTNSPNATATLLMSATTKIPPTTLTWAWNLKYGLLCYLCAVLVFVVIA